MSGLRRLVAPLLALGVVGAVVGLGSGQRRARADAERQVAGAVASRLDAHVEAQLQVVAELADRFARWEVLPRAALVDSLRSVASRHRDLRQLVVADRAGRVLAGWDTSQPLGRETVAPGTLDPVLGRRQVITRRGGLLVRGESRAGRLGRLWVAAAIGRPDGTRPGYVSATLDLAALRRSLARTTPGRIRMKVETRQGQRLFPCALDQEVGGHASETARFRVWVALGAPRPWGWWGAALACLAGLLWLALRRGAPGSRAPGSSPP